VERCRHSPVCPHGVMLNVTQAYLYLYSYLHQGYAVAQLVETLYYKPEGRGFDSRWSHWNFSVT
jgi:hypothetical protein